MTYFLLSCKIPIPAIYVIEPTSICEGSDIGSTFYHNFNKPGSSHNQSQSQGHTVSHDQRGLTRKQGSVSQIPEEKSDVTSTDSVPNAHNSESEKKLHKTGSEELLAQLTTTVESPPRVKNKVAKYSSGNAFLLDKVVPLLNSESALKESGSILKANEKNGAKSPNQGVNGIVLTL
ncbi:unnamed protein product [Owenia fusiformis]|uniref:Uncharacterized protein n=1 Tax=Owenia fusiformis TaxID=6347 RepID=A0A8S4QB31_OWEFU|nr:unnamed protein product [Owenia fusiformis]